MTDQPEPPNRLTEVLRLSAHLTRQVLDAQLAEQPILPEQVRALANAALLLDEYGVPLPSMLVQVLHDVSGEAAPASDETKGDGEADAPGRLARLAGLFKGSR